MGLYTSGMDFLVALSDLPSAKVILIGGIDDWDMIQLGLLIKNRENWHHLELIGIYDESKEAAHSAYFDHVFDRLFALPEDETEWSNLSISLDLIESAV